MVLYEFEWPTTRGLNPRALLELEFEPPSLLSHFSFRPFPPTFPDLVPTLFADLRPCFSSLSQVWSTANVLRTQVELENHLAKGLKLDLATTLNPEKNAKGAVVTAVFKTPGVHAKATVDLFKVRISRSSI